jgi:hypothetical protein
MNCSLSEGASRYLDALYETYDSFDVQQTTVAASPVEFERVADNPEGIAVRVAVESEAGTLALPDGDDWELPRGVIDEDPTRSRIADLVARQSGVRCEIDSLERVSLVCLQSDVDDSEVWTLSARFSATKTGGTPVDDAVWRTETDRLAVSVRP